MHLAWATDVHLNFVTPDEQRLFAHSLLGDDPEAVIITGDISEAHTLSADLSTLGGHVQRPVYFVLGNHDFYGSNVARVRAAAEELTQRDPFVRWLPAVGIVPLSDTVALLGHDGWADGRAGDFAHSPIRLNDHIYIADVTNLGPVALLAQMQSLADESAAYLARELPTALERYQHVVVATHLPPFREACWHEGAISNDDWSPFFTCVSVGEAIREAALAWPQRQITVLCGHTHSPGVAEILPNLIVHTGGAEYGAPALAATLTL